MKTFSNEIRIAIEKALAIYKTSPEYTLKNEETGFTVELMIKHTTDHLMTELKHYIRFLTGQRIMSWDVIPENDENVRLVLRISNGWEPVNNNIRSGNSRKTKQ